MTCFYEILEVSKNATQNDIKIAYRKKALEHHPDKGGNADIFKNIQSAYETLKDPVTRQEYDNPPVNNIPHGFGNGFANIFRQHSTGGFNINDFFNAHMNMNVNANNNQPQVISTIVNLTLFDIFNGINKDIHFKINTECHSCASICNVCNGQCMVQKIEHTPMGHRISMSQCSNCTNGNVFNNTDCSICNNTRVITTNEVIPFKVIPGIPDNHVVNIRFTKNNKSYVLNLTFKIDHLKYTRNELDLILDIDIPFISTISGQTNNIILPDATNTNINSLNFNEVIKHHKLYKTDLSAIPFFDSNSNQITKYGKIYIKYNIINSNINTELIKKDNLEIINFLTKYIVS